jgi:hypothetical protein
MPLFSNMAKLPVYGKRTQSKCQHPRVAESNGLSVRRQVGHFGPVRGTELRDAQLPSGIKSRSCGDTEIGPAGSRQECSKTKLRLAKLFAF